ncbi:MAG: rhomboid family intramembrane serine protease [Flavobacteriales bacterium]|nr:rhomboid family intramembrane serine protease [Flavobacteriales bacterium]
MAKGPGRVLLSAAMPNMKMLKMRATILKWWKSGMAPRLLMVNSAVFLLLTLLSLALTLGADPLQSYPGAYTLAASHDLSIMLGRPWAVLTHMFAHESPTHFALNMLMLFWTGGMVEQLWGGRRLLRLYLLGGLGGYLTYVLALAFVPGWTPANPFVLGASAAVLALFVAAATANPHKKIAMPFVGALELRWLAIAFVVLDLIYLGASEDPASKAGHLGGALLGFLWALSCESRFARFKFWRSTSPLKAVSSDHARPVSDDEFNARRRQQRDRIDRILDKISRDGYDSLSKEEKSFLFKHGGNA